MNIITSAFLAARPKTLTASLIPVWAGCMVVQKLTGNWNAALALLTLASCLCLQIACNFFNDAIDHAKHADTERRTGPVRMTASGALSHGTVMIIGLDPVGAGGGCAAESHQEQRPDGRSAHAQGNSPQMAVSAKSS